MAERERIIHLVGPLWLAMHTQCEHTRRQVQHLRDVPYRPWWSPWRRQWRLVCADCLDEMYPADAAPAPHNQGGERWLS